MAVLFFFMLTIIIILAIILFFTMRNQKKIVNEHDEMVQKLKENHIKYIQKNRKKLEEVHGK